MSSKLYGPIRAGRAFRESDSSNNVVATNTQGDITITENDDGLVHFNWNNRQTQTTDVVSVLSICLFQPCSLFNFACFVGSHHLSIRCHLHPSHPVCWRKDVRPQVLVLRPAIFLLAARQLDTLVLYRRVVSSWSYLSEHADAHATHAANINGLLQDPEHEVDEIPAAPAASTSAAASSSQAAPQLSAEQLNAFRSLVAGLPQQDGALSGVPEYALSDILSPAALAPLFESASPETLRAIFPTLPSDLPIPPSPEALRQVVESPPFQGQVRALDRALRTGLVGSLVVGLGLPEEAGLGLGPFLAAIQEQAKRKREEGGGESMETD